MYEIKQLSSEELEALRNQFPYSNIEEWQVLEDGTALGYYSTADRAALEVSKWQGRDAIQGVIEDKLPVLIDELQELGSWYGIDSAEVRSMLRSSV